jgi:hypothetical protein
MTNEDFRRIARTLGPKSTLSEADLKKLAPEDRAMVRKEIALTRAASQRATPVAPAPEPVTTNEESPQ